MPEQTIRALSLWQPWASLIAIGAKTIETRGWAAPRHAVGDLVAIHAAKRWAADERWTAESEPFRSALAAGGIGIAPSQFDYPTSAGRSMTPPLGCIVAVARLARCERMTPETIDAVEYPERAFGLYEPGRFAWHLEAVRRLDEPVPYRGGQGLFTVPLSAIAGRAMTEVSR